MLRIDAHQHYWTISRGDYGWITPELPKVYRDFLPEDLKPLLSKHDLDGTILVQAAPTLEETEYILSLAEADETILGVVGYLDLNDPNCIQHHRQFAKHPKYVGFRIMIQDMPDARAILAPHFVEALKYFEQADVPVDLLVTSGQLEPVMKLMEQVPQLRGVIDHLAKPEIRSGRLQPWAEQMQQLAAYPKLYCKISGMVTEADHDNWQLEQFEPYIRTVMDAFGTERIMFGSDWPVCLLAASYDEVVQIVEQAIPADWPSESRKRLFGGNAKTFYKL